MQIDQVIIRPEDQQVITLFTNSVGIGGNVTIPYSELQAPETNSLAVLMGTVQARLPADPPASVKQEIEELEARLIELRKSVGLIP